MKKFALLFILLLCAVSAKSQTTAVVLIDCDDKKEAELLRSVIELQLGLTGKVTFGHFPAKLQLSITIKSIELKGQVTGYAIAYTHTEGVFYQRIPRLVLLGSGVIVTPTILDASDMLVKDFEEFIDQPRL